MSERRRNIAAICTCLLLAVAGCFGPAGTSRPTDPKPAPGPVVIADPVLLQQVKAALAGDKSTAAKYASVYRAMAALVRSRVDITKPEVVSITAGATKDLGGKLSTVAASHFASLSQSGAIDREATAKLFEALATACEGV